MFVNKALGVQGDKTKFNIKNLIYNGFEHNIFITGLVI